MPKITPLHHREVIRKLQKLWYTGPIFGWRHATMKLGERKIPIPIHWNKDIRIGLIRTIINQIGISTHEWIKL